MLLAKSLNIALSSDYWIVGIFIANTFAIIMATSWEAFSVKTKEMIKMTMFISSILLVILAASEELV
ncbi:hypothetical protein [Bacillus cereus]|uniref:hypothetical protein n=1 Tax=Bacillus cereus TaxID=1396 RepID=UPI0002D725A2|nr:hypothetical protein [Bacillus cereus]